MKKKWRNEVMKFLVYFNSESGKQFPYSLHADSFEEAQERAQKLAAGYGWTYLYLESA